jgi:5'(3')-deoxyribonucleotidase
MRNLTILCDLDGVVIDLMPEWRRRINTEGCPLLRKTRMSKGLDTPNECEVRRKTCRCVRAADIDSWNAIVTKSSVSERRTWEVLHESSLYDCCKPIPGALEGLQALRAAGHRVVFVTSTNLHQNGAKLRWLERHGFLELKHGSISGDYIEAHDKSLIRGDVLIDDGEHNVQAWLDATDGEGMALLFDAPWNRTPSIRGAYGLVSGWEATTETVLRYGQFLGELLGDSNPASEGTAK